MILAHLLPDWLWQLAHWPVDSGSNGGYGFWSGIGSDFGEVTLIVAIVAWWHHINCIEKGCWRKGHADPEHGHPLCKKHQDKLSTS